MTRALLHGVRAGLISALTVFALWAGLGLAFDRWGTLTGSD